MTQMFSRRRLRGFTLVEMMVVIVIIGILAGVVIVNISGKADKAKVTTTEALIKKVAGEVDLFKLDHNRYPDSLMDLYKMPSYVDPKKWPPGGYLNEPPLDAWGRELLIRVPGPEGAPFDIMSLGEDGREGGEGFAADIFFRKRPR